MRKWRFSSLTKQEFLLHRKRQLDGKIEFTLTSYSLGKFNDHSFRTNSLARQTVFSQDLKSELIAAMYLQNLFCKPDFLFLSLISKPLIDIWNGWLRMVTCRLGEHAKRAMWS